MLFPELVNIKPLPETIRFLRQCRAATVIQYAGKAGTGVHKAVWNMKPIRTIELDRGETGTRDVLILWVSHFDAPVVPASAV